MFALLVLGIWPAGKARAETVVQAYDRALKDYYAGRYQVAIAGFERLVAIPMRHEDLYYNLGCAYFREGKLGPAIFNFERARALDPSADDAAFNLETAKQAAASRAKDVLKGVAEQSLWVRAVTVFRQNTWTVVFLAVWWATLLILIAVRRVRPGPAKAGLIAAAAFVGLLSLVSGGMLAGRLYLKQGTESAVVLPDILAVQEGPSADTKKLFSLHAGFRVSIRGKSGAWSRIRLTNGLEGWVSRGHLGLL
jgi:tetratricopeptide (TPR) repeat protein